MQVLLIGSLEGVKKSLKVVLSEFQGYLFLESLFSVCLKEAPGVC